MKLLKCSVCGKVVLVMDNENNTDTICCGKPMEEVQIKEKDEGTEKHTPYVKIKNGCAFVKIGSIIHPSEENHYIKAIALCFEDGFYVKQLSSKDVPEIVIPIGCHKNLKAAYCYCNIHGGWKCAKDCFIECRKKS